MLANAKKIALFTSGAASQKYMQQLVDQQEIMGALADIVIETYAADSALLRALKVIEHHGESAASLPVAMARVYLQQALEKIETSARKVITAIAEGDMLRTQLAILKRLSKYEPFNTIALRQQIAQRVIETGKYTAV